jgi:hypothetical protein
MKALGTLALLAVATNLSCSNDLDKPVSCVATHSVGYRINQDNVNEGLHEDAAEYYTQLKFGADGSEVINVVVDTGSANLIVQGNQSICPTCDTDENSYTPGASATTDGENFKIQYGLGATGTAIEYKDSVSLLCGGPIQKKFGVLKETNNVSNILGLAYVALEQQTPSKDLVPFFRQLVDSGLSANIFSLLLCNHKGGSNIIFGGNDPRVKDGDVKMYTPIIKETYYVVDARNLSFSTGELIGEFKGASQGTEVILDSGSTMLILPPEMITPIVTKLKAVASQKGITFPANFWTTTAIPKGTNMPTQELTEEQIALFPSLKLTMWDQSDSTGTKVITLTISPDTYFKSWDSPSKRAFAFRSSTDNKVVLGQPLFENYYMVFDRANKRVGFLEDDNLCTGK